MQHTLTSAGWIEGTKTRATEGEFHVDDRAVAPSDYVTFFVTGANQLERVQYLWSEFDWVRLEPRSAISASARNLHRVILDRSDDQHLLLGRLTNSELFVLAPINCQARRLLEVFVRAGVDVKQ